RTPILALWPDRYSAGGEIGNRADCLSLGWRPRRQWRTCWRNDQLGNVNHQLSDLQSADVYLRLEFRSSSEHSPRKRNPNLATSGQHRSAQMPAVRISCCMPLLACGKSDRRDATRLGGS